MSPRRLCNVSAMLFFGVCRAARVPFGREQHGQHAGGQHGGVRRHRAPDRPCVCAPHVHPAGAAPHAARA
eukprot:4002888-Pyramimonas_sp.AAC.1